MFADHPGLTEEDLCHELYRRTVKDNRKTGKTYVNPLLVTDPTCELLCHNCKWNERHEHYSAYTSRVSVLHVRANKALWNIGPNWILRDEPNDYTLANDCDAMEFLQSQNTTIPVPKIHRLSGPTDKFHLTLMSRAQGEPLYNVWHTFTQEQLQSIAKQLGGYIRQWRQFTAPRAQKVNGERLHDLLVGTCRGWIPECKRIGYTTEEWLDDLSPELRKGLATEDESLEQDPQRLDQLLHELKDGFPKGGPYVFTHGDINPSNIIVSAEGKITGIIDWERAGFYPWWAERFFAQQIPDVRFREMLDMIQDDICPGYNRATFVDKINRHVGRARNIFEACPRLHRGEENVWVRPPFCECKPYSGRIGQEDIGVAPTHEIVEELPMFNAEDFKALLGDWSTT
jgi:aminoglycoside phosphotransferase (APT) family kinase protein